MLVKAGFTAIIGWSGRLGSVSTMGCVLCIMAASSAVVSGFGSGMASVSPIMRAALGATQGERTMSANGWPLVQGVESVHWVACSFWKRTILRDFKGKFRKSIFGSTPGPFLTVGGPVLVFAFMWARYRDSSCLA